MSNVLVILVPSEHTSAVNVPLKSEACPTCLDVREGLVTLRVQGFAMCTGIVQMDPLSKAPLVAKWDRRKQTTDHTRVETQTQTCLEGAVEAVAPARDHPLQLGAGFEDRGSSLCAF
jgi:hypothetical protein